MILEIVERRAYGSFVDERAPVAGRRVKPRLVEYSQARQECVRSRDRQQSRGCVLLRISQGGARHPRQLEQSAKTIEQPPQDGEVFDDSVCAEHKYRFANRVGQRRSSSVFREVDQKPLPHRLTLIGGRDSILIDKRGELEGQHARSPASLEQRNQCLLNQRVVDYRPAKRIPLARIVASFEERSMQYAAGVRCVMDSRGIDYIVHQRLESVGRIADRPRGSPVEINLRGRQRLSAELVFQSPERNLVDLTVG